MTAGALRGLARDALEHPERWLGPGDVIDLAAQAATLGRAVQLVGRDPDRAANWRADPDIRRTFLGGSDAAAALGIDPYRSPVALWLDKLGRGEPFDGNNATDWGNRLEPVIAEWLADTRPDLTVINPAGHTWRHPDRPWQACTPDRLAIDPARPGFGVVQIKTAGWHVRHDWEGGDAPAPYVAQVLHEAIVLGADWGLLVCLVAGRDPYVVDVDIAPDLVDTINRAEARVWRHVVEGTEPPLAGHADEADDLACVWVPDDEAAVELDDEAAEALRSLYATDAELKRIAAHRDRLRATVEAALGPATVGLLDGRPAVTWRARTELDDALLGLERPDLYWRTLDRPRPSATRLRAIDRRAADHYRRPAGRTFRPTPPKDPNP